MRIHHLNTATLCPLSARLVNGVGPWLGRARLVCHCLLVETASGLVLVDTGLGRGDLENPQRLGARWVRQVAPKLDTDETAFAQLARLGYAPSDLTDIVLTHLDLDHAGGIADFPHALVHVHARERDGGNEGKARYIPAHIAHGPRWALFDDGGERWFGFEGVRALPGHDDVLLVPLPGHTLGHTAVAVRTADGWLLHAGDAYFHHGQLEERANAPWALRLFQKRGDMDRPARIANQERLRKLALAEPTVRVFCAHDPEEMISDTTVPIRGRTG